MPHPAVLEKYNEVAPHAADRILKLAEEEARHRINMESAAMNARIERAEWHAMERRVGQFIALIVCLSTLGAGIWLAWNGRELSGTLIVFLGLFSLVLAAMASRPQAGSRRQPDHPDK